MRKEEIHRYLPIIILLAMISLSIFIIKDYIIAIIGAFIIAYLIYPIHKKIEKKMPPWASALTTLAGAIIILFLPIILIIKEIISQVSFAIRSGAITKSINYIEGLEIIKKYNLNLSDLTNKFFDIGIKTLSSVTVSVATSIISLLVMIFIIYYLLLNWSNLRIKIKKYIPFDNKEKLLSEMADTTKKIVHGTFFIALMEALIAGLGFWLAGIDFYLILATLIALFAFIPGGPGVIWIPTLIIEILQKNYLQAGIILAFGLFISIYIEIILRTRIAGKESRIHPVIMLLGIIGGTPIMGIAGIVVGPLLLSYTLEILEEIIGEH